MTRFAGRFLETGRQEGLEQGIEQGAPEAWGRHRPRPGAVRLAPHGTLRGSDKRRVLLRQLTLKFGPLPEAAQVRVESADADTLLRWSEPVLTAGTLDEVLQ